MRGWTAISIRGVTPSEGRVRIGIDARMVAYRKSGIARYTTSLLTALQNEHSEYDVIPLTARRGWARIGSLACGRQRTLYTPPHHRLEAWSLPLELAALRLDIYHGTDFAVPRVWGKTAAVVTVHDLYFLRDPAVLDRTSSRYYRQAIRTLSRASAIIAVSEQTRRDLLEFTPVDRDRVTVVHEAAAPHYRPFTAGQLAEARASLATRLPPAAQRVISGDAGPYLLFVGTIEPRKNLLMLLQAYVEYRHRAGDRAATLVLVGAAGWRDGGETAEIARLQALGQLIWLGTVDDALLPMLYNGASAVLLPSRYEGFGLTALEALACGVPVVASNVASLPEVVGDAGLLLPVDESTAWAAALHELLGNAEMRRRLQEAGPRRAARFSWSRAATKTLEVYQDALRLRRTRAAPGTWPQ